MAKKATHKWSREGTIVALDYYMRHFPGVSTSMDGFEELHGLMNRIGRKVHGKIPSLSRESIDAKMRNFAHLNPDDSGLGLSRATTLDKELWDVYASNLKELRQAAKTIQVFIESDEVLPSSDIISDYEEEAEEGRILTLIHRTRERSRKIVERKKKKVLEQIGRLECEVCGFNFASRYGERGEDFIECHHIKPVSKLNPGAGTKLSDLALVCSNCHRMIHRRRPWLSINELRELLISDSK